MARRLSGFSRLLGIACLALFFPVHDSIAQKNRGARADAGNSSPLLYPPGQSPTSKRGRRSSDPEESAAQALMDEFGHFLQRLETLEDEVAQLNGVIEEQGLALRRMKEEQKERYLALDRRVSSGGQGYNPEASSSSDFSLDDGLDLYRNDEQSTYDAAFALMQQQDYAGAAKAFQLLLLQYPDGGTTGDAFFWIGEIYLALPDPKIEESQQAFMALIERFPQHGRVSGALFKLGHIYDQLGQEDQSVYYLNRVLEEYPDSATARLAADYLEKSG